MRIVLNYTFEQFTAVAYFCFVCMLFCVLAAYLLSNKKQRSGLSVAASALLLALSYAGFLLALVSPTVQNRLDWLSFGYCLQMLGILLKTVSMLKHRYRITMTIIFALGAFGVLTSMLFGWFYLEVSSRSIQYSTGYVLLASLYTFSFLIEIYHLIIQLPEKHSVSYRVVMLSCCLLLGLAALLDLTHVNRIIISYVTFIAPVPLVVVMALLTSTNDENRLISASPLVAHTMEDYYFVFSSSNDLVYANKVFYVGDKTFDYPSSLDNFCAFIEPLAACKSEFKAFIASLLVNEGMGRIALGQGVFEYALHRASSRKGYCILKLTDITSYENKKEALAEEQRELEAGIQALKSEISTIDDIAREKQLSDLIKQIYMKLGHVFAELVKTLEGCELAPEEKKKEMLEHAIACARNALSEVRKTVSLLKQNEV